MNSADGWSTKGQASSYFITNVKAPTASVRVRPTMLVITNVNAAPATCPHWWSALSKGTRAVARHECIHSMLLLDSDDGTDLTSGPYVLLILSIYFVNIVMILRFN